MTERICPKCGSPNQVSQERCTNCGAVLEPKRDKRECPACHVVPPAGATTCPNCGERLSK